MDGEPTGTEIQPTAWYQVNFSTTPITGTREEDDPRATNARDLRANPLSCSRTDTSATFDSPPTLPPRRH
ncbi:hypothetical protein GCM10009668_16030 [Nocardioides dubius]|uniref:Uncharacterized protein n=1 Tax=Nocardioides dubius TaxID=317019 RepID=A0ABN1TRE3_9ACTN